MNKIYFFNSGNFNSYNLDSGVIGSYFFKDVNNNLYLFGYNNSVTVQYSYKLINDSMHLITWDTLGLSNGKSSFLIKCNKDILMLGNPYSGSNSLLIFNGQNWIHYMDTDFGIFKLGGYSKDSLFAIELTGFIHVWEDNKWIKSDSVLFQWLSQGFNFGDVILKDSKLFFYGKFRW